MPHFLYSFHWKIFHNVSVPNQKCLDFKSQDIQTSMLSTVQFQFNKKPTNSKNIHFYLLAGFMTFRS